MDACRLLVAARALAVVDDAAGAHVRVLYVTAVTVFI